MSDAQSEQLALLSVSLFVLKLTEGFRCTKYLIDPHNTKLTTFLCPALQTSLFCFVKLELHYVCM